MSGELVVPLRPADGDDFSKLGAVLGRAEWAARAYGCYDRDSVERIVDAVALAGGAGAEAYAEQVVAGSGRGVIGDKAIRYASCVAELRQAYHGHDYVSPRSGSSPGVVDIPRAAGVVLALMPAEEAVTAVLYTCLIALLTRNALVLSPHPADSGWCIDLVSDLRDAAIASGAPDGIIAVGSATAAVGEDPRSANDPRSGNGLPGDSDLRLGDDRTAMVLDARRPPGRVPVLVDATADLARTAARLVASKSFDNSSEGPSESILIAHNSILLDLLDHMQLTGAYLLSIDERDRVRQLLFPGGEFDPRWRGVDAVSIAGELGIEAPPRTKLLLAQIDFVRSEEVLSHHMPCPVLGIVGARSVDNGIRASRAALRASGAGWAAVHSNDDQTVLNFGSRVGARRVVVNAGLNALSASSWPVGFEAGHLIRWTRVIVDQGDGFVDLTRLSGSGALVPPSPAPGDPVVRTARSAAPVPPYPQASNLPPDA